MKKTYKIICIYRKSGIYLPSDSGIKPERLVLFIHLLNFFIMEKFDEIYNYLTENQFFTDDELILVCNINGHSVKTLNDAIYARYGFSDFDDFLNDLA